MILAIPNVSRPLHDILPALHGVPFTSLPLLPPREIADAVSDIEAQLDADSQHASRLQKLIAYVNRQWITKRSIGPERLSVRDNRSRTNNVLESFHVALRRRIKVSHPNL